MIVITCRCGHQFQEEDGDAGTRIRCPKCQVPVRVPSVSAPAPAAPPAGDESWSSFEHHLARRLRHLSAQLDEARGVLLLIAWRLGWILFLLALPIILGVLSFVTFGGLAALIR
jgi:hypothetical protein